MSVCSRCGENEQLPTGTLCRGCVEDDIAEYDDHDSETGTDHSGGKDD